MCLCIGTNAPHKTIKHVYLMHHGHIQFPMGTFRSGGIKQPIYHPLEQWSQTNMIVPITYTCLFYTPYFCKTFSPSIPIFQPSHQL